MTRFRKYFFRIIKWTGIVLILLFAGVFTYVSFNKKEIIAQVIEMVSEKIEGNVQISKVELSFFRNFPDVSVLLHDIRITDTLYPQHQKAFLHAREVFISLSVIKMIKSEVPVKGIRIDKAKIHVFTDSTGYTNGYLGKGKEKKIKADNSDEESVFRKIELNSVNIVMEDAIKGKYHDFLVKDIDIRRTGDLNPAKFRTKLNMKVRSLAFNTRKGSFLENKTVKGDFSFQFDIASKQLELDNIILRIEGQPFQISGNFDLGSKEALFKLDIATDKVSYNSLKTLFPPKIYKSLSLVEIDDLEKVSATINGRLKGGEPKVYASWNAKNTRLLTPFMDFEQTSFKGFFSNEVDPGLPRKDSNSRIQLNEFTAEWRGLPVASAKIDILNLTNPALSCDLESQFDLKKLNEVLGSNSISAKSGKAVVNLTYNGPVEKNTQTNSFINGKVTISDGLITYKPRKVDMEKVSAVISFRNSDVFVDNLRTTVLGQTITMNGEGRNLLTLIHTEPNRAVIKWQINSSSLDLTPFVFLFKAREKNEESVKGKGIANAAGKLDDVLERGRLDVIVKAGKIKYKKFTGSNLIADLSLLQDRYLLHKVSMQHAGGSMNLDGSLVNTSTGAHKANLNVLMNNVDVQEVFSAFNNFGQDGITSESIEGKLTSNVVASMMLNEEGKVLPSTLISTINFSLKKGALNNYEPLKKIQKFIFKNRDFENIRFAELKNTLLIKNQEVKINRMEIQSSVLTMFVEGVYSMAGNTDMSIQLPLNNLKKRSADFNPVNMGVDQKVKKSVFLRGRPGDDGNIQFKLDVFNRYNKEKSK